MSSITKMQVSGIRSFNPDRKECIEFFFPLTLILGPNGTGKTTIIECLKYITTGDMPPNASKDGAFVHDPKVHHSSEVKAQVKLQFVDTQKKMCIATRSLQATQKAKAVKCNTLDSTIHRTGDSGETTTISNKCAEMNKEMISLLGVSKAILENVIFVHQEEANWPLSEGKTLKEKFDAIFASTRYVKALEKIRACRGGLATNITMFKTESKYLEQCKDKAQEISDSKDKIEGKYVAHREMVNDIKKQLEPIDNKLDQLSSKTGDVTKLHTKIEKLKGSKEEMEQNCKDLQEQIKEEFEGSTDELKRALSEFDNKVKDMKENLNKLENKLERLEQESAKYDREKAKVLLEQGKLEQEAKRYQETLKNRDNKVRQTAEECDITGYAGTLTDDHIMEFINELSSVGKEVLGKAKEKKEEFEQKEKGFQREIEQQRDERMKLDTQCKMKLDRMQKSKGEVREINRQLSQILSSGERLKEVERDLRSTTRELEEVKNAVDVDSLKTEVTQLQKEKIEFDAKLKNLDSEMSRISTESTARTQLDMHRKEKTSKEEQVQRLLSKNEDTLRLILGTVPTQNLKRAVDEFIYKQTRELGNERDSLHTLQGSLTKLETTKKMEMHTLNKKEDELRVSNQKIADVCDGEDFDTKLDEVQVKMKKSETERGYLKAMNRVFSRYVTELEKNAKCPLCHRGWGDDSQTAVHELTSDIETKISMVPDKLITTESDLKKFKTKYEAMLTLTSVRETVTDLSEVDIPNLKAKIKKLGDQIETVKGEIEEKKESVDVLGTDEATGKSILPDMTLIDRYQNELKDLDRRIAQQASKLSGGDHGRTLSEVQTEREDIQLQLESINRNLDRKREKISQHTERLQQLKTQVHDLKSDQFKIESELQKRTTLEETKEDLDATIVTLEQEIKEGKSQRQPIQDKIDKLILEKNEVVSQKDIQFEKDKDKFNRIRDHSKEINVCQKEIEKYIHDGKAEQLEDSRERKSQIESKQCGLDLQRDDLTEQINQTRDDLSSQQIRYRELSDNLQLRKRKKEVEMKEREISEQEEKLGGLDVTNLNREMRELSAQQDELMQDRNVALGRQRGFEDEILRYKKELNEDMYKDAEKKYRDKLYDLRTTELAKNDLEKYYEALNSTIMTFHTQKMSDINKIIRELWRNTYKGNDIETIEIRTDGDAVQDLDKRRNYSYRVVMIKGDAAIDMRGRCSAGQKVLASLIIRLALAETFCLNCGILALDEPTTNLDRENIESLAFALVEIIKGRERQKNFQLVVITHDEDFVELLGRSEYVDQFYRVKKDVHGCSKLEKSRVDQLHLR